MKIEVKIQGKLKESQIEVWHDTETGATKLEDWAGHYLLVDDILADKLIKLFTGLKRVREGWSADPYEDFGEEFEKEIESEFEEQGLPFSTVEAIK